jgi:hypothetical protein
MIEIERDANKVLRLEHVILKKHKNGSKFLIPSPFVENELLKPDHRYTIYIIDEDGNDGRVERDT